MSRRMMFAGFLLMAAAGLGMVAIRGVLQPVPVQSPTLAIAPVPPVERIRILVAANALPSGTLVREEDLRSLATDADTVPRDALPDTPAIRAELRGALVREWLEAGQPLRRDAVLRPRDRGFLAAVLKPGARAVAIGVDAVTGAAGLIAPGDEVDLILTQDFGREHAAPATRVVSETILTGARVIAVDQQIAQGAPAMEPGAAAGRVARTVTLEVSPAEAERVAVGERLGRLSLSVRAMAPPVGPVAQRATATFAADVSPALSPRASDTGARMRVFQGNDASEVIFR